MDSRLKAIIERNRNPRVTSEDEFDAWIMAPKASLFKRRAAEVLWAARAMRMILAEQGRNYSHTVAVHLARMDELMNMARGA